MNVKKQIFELFDKLEDTEKLVVLGELETKIKTKVNAVSELNDKHQRFFRENIEKEVWQEGEGNDAKVWCRLILANNTSYKAWGKNKKIAGEKAALKALKDFDKITFEEANLRRIKKKY